MASAVHNHVTLSKRAPTNIAYPTSPPPPAPRALHTQRFAGSSGIHRTITKPNIGQSNSKFVDMAHDPTQLDPLTYRYRYACTFPVPKMHPNPSEKSTCTSQVNVIHAPSERKPHVCVTLGSR